MSHFIDGFYRTYENNSSNSAQPRSSEPGIKLVDDKWNAQSKSLVNVNPGLHAGEVVTTDQALIIDGNSFKVGKHKFEFMNSNKCGWNGKKRKLTDISAGELESDAATVGQVILKNDVKIMKSNNNGWDGKKMKLTDISDGVAQSDAATVGQVMLKSNEEFMKTNTNGWDGKKRKLTDIIDGVAQSDCATVGQVVLKNAGEIMKANNNGWAGQNNKISNVAKGTGDNDVAICNVLIIICLK